MSIAPQDDRSSSTDRPEIKSTDRPEIDARQILDTLRRSPLCEGLHPDELRALAAAMKPARFRSGQVIIRQDEPGHGLFIVARGRVKISLDRGGGDYGLLEYLGRGAHFGEMAVLTDGLNTATATAVMDTDLLELPERDFHRLMLAAPRFATNLSRRLGMRLRRVTRERFSRHRPAVIGLVNSTIRTQSVLGLLAKALVERGDRLVAITERADAWSTDGAYLIERIHGDLQAEGKIQAVRSRIAQVVEMQDRVLLDVTQREVERVLPELLSQCEAVFWLVEPAFLETSCRNLQRLAAIDPDLARRVHLVWVLHETDRYAPPLPFELPIHPINFKVIVGDAPQRSSWRQQQSILRIARHLLGARVGLALSGGGARGFAHLGVLRAFDRAGIFFDLVAGTSIGALMGLSYCAGWDPDEALPQFVEHLTPPKLLRKIPGGSRWFMYGMFRLRGWDRMLRPFLGDCSLEQLQIPLSIVVADLLTGTQVVRDRGDAIHALMESINLPGISLPILRDGMALVDGGILNNLPADVLPARGADLVVGVDIMSKLSRRFGRNISGMKTERMRTPGTIETLLRVSEVQDYALATLHARRVDLLVAPDTSKFDFADFTQGMRLAEVGEAAAEELAPQLRQMIAEIERK